MALNYRVWTEEEIKGRHVTEEGEYPFRILTVINTRTKEKLDEHGNPKPRYDMLEMEITYTDNNGVTKYIKDWIILDPKMDWKLRHLAKSVGLIETYENKTLDARHLLNRKGYFLLGIKEETWNGEVRKKNFIKDYLIPVISITKVGEVTTSIDMNIGKVTIDDTLNDDIPF